MTAQDSRVCRRGASIVGRRGQVVTCVPKKIVRDFSSNEGVHQTELVAGPKWKTWSPQLSLMVIGGTRGCGWGPRSYFHRTLPDFGSRAMTKPRPVQPL